MLRPLLALLTLCAAGCPATPNGETPDVTTPSATAAPALSSAPVVEQPEPKNTQPKDAQTLFVDSKVVDCEGEGPMKCMRVRESESAEWTLFYQRIEGFSHEEGYRYELKVAITPVSDRPAGSSSRHYRLIEVVSKKKEAP